MPRRPRPSLARSLGRFFGEIGRAVAAEPGKGDGPREVSRTIEEEQRSTPEGRMTLRRTVIEEIEIEPPGPQNAGSESGGRG